MKERIIRLSWLQLELILQKTLQVLDDEEIVGITLVKPKHLHVKVKIWGKIKDEN